MKFRAYVVLALCILLVPVLVAFARKGAAPIHYHPTIYRVLVGTGEVTCNRTTGATYDAGQTDGRITVSANALRIEKVCSASIPSPTDMGAYIPLAADNTRGLLLIHSFADSTVLLSMDAHDDGSPETVADIDNLTSLANPHIAAVRCQDDGSWLLWIARPQTQVYDGATDAEVYRSINAGSSWTMVHSNVHGGPPNSGPGVPSSGARVAYGDYKDDEVAGAHHGWHVWYSEDYGVNWDTIYTRPNPEGANNVFHWHGAALDPDDSTVVWSYYGDVITDTEPDTYPPIVKLTKPTGWKPGGGAWAITQTWQEAIEDNHDSFLPLGLGEYLTGCNRTWIWTPATSELEEVFSPPRQFEATANYKYYYGQRTEVCRGLLRYNSTIYQPVSHYTAEETNRNTHLIVSADGRHWTTINHLPNTTRGWKAVHCYFDGYLWGYTEPTAGGLKMYKFAPISTRTVNAIRVDLPYTNQLAAREDSTFTTAGEAADLGNWANLGPDFGWGTVEAIAGGSDDSGHQWHGVADDDDKDNQCNITTFAQMATPLANGDYVVMALDIWRGTSYSMNYEYFQILDTDANVDWTPNGSFLATKRHRSIHCGKATGVPGANKWYLVHSAFNDGQAYPFHCYIDSAALYTSTTHWPTWAAFRPSPTAGTAELVTIPLGGLGTSWTIAFDFQAGNSLELVADHAICCLHGANGDYIDLEFVAASEKYRITDQDATSATLANAARRRWNDLVRVVITCDGTDTELHIFDAVSGEQTIGDGVGVLMDNGPPSHLRLATNNDESVRGQGLFWGFKRWNSCLSSAEITAHWAVPGEGVATRAIGK